MLFSTSSSHCLLFRALPKRPALEYVLMTHVVSFEAVDNFITWGTGAEPESYICAEQDSSAEGYSNYPVMSGLRRVLGSDWQLLSDN